MPLATDFMHCIDEPPALDAPLSHVDPFMALRFHFGMLLGVADFEAQQAYHRGKMRLHNAWLHGAGVVWGLGVGVARDANEIRVEPGLALDGAGHELYLEARACVNIGAWYEKHEQDPDVIAAVDTSVAGERRLAAHVVARFRPCLTREVPALSEPCEGGNTDTAFSRVAETMLLELRPGAPPAASAPAYGRARVFLGLEPPREDGGVIVAEHQAVLDERARIAGLISSERPAAIAAAVRRFVTEDAIERMPGSDADGDRVLFPAPDSAVVVLGEIDQMQLRRQNGVWTLLNDPAVRYDARETLLPTSELQHLVLSASRIATSAGGPALLSIAIPDDHTVRIAFASALDAATVVDAAFSVSSRAAGAAWTTHPATASASADGKTVTLALGAGHTIAVGELVRVVARGSGPAPLVGTDGAALTSDVVAMQKRS